MISIFTRRIASPNDGMDQKTTNIPKLRRKTKATCNLTSVCTHLVGAIFHSGQSSTGKYILGSFDYYQWPHDPNLTATVLLKMLFEWGKCKKFPPISNLQMDNCVKENKNQYMMWLLALLVELLVFDKVCLVKTKCNVQCNLHLFIVCPGTSLAFIFLFFILF